MSEHIKIKEVKDPWKKLRDDLKLFQPIEPLVELLAVPMMGETDIVEHLLDPSKGPIIMSPERIPGYVARMSHQTESSPEGDIKLNRNLLKMSPVPHKGPFEFCFWTFRITGVSKSCLTQFDRARVGIGFVQMSGRYIDRNKTGFIYNIYDYIEEKTVRELLIADSRFYEMSMDIYNDRLTFGVTKQDARKCLPVSFATGTYVHMNSTSLRNLFQLRLDSHAEWEIRRMCRMMWSKCITVAPSHFEDMIEVVP